jgi:hypothetical protein
VNEIVERAAKALFEKHHQDKLRLIREGTVSASMSGIEYYQVGWEAQDESVKEYLRGEVRAVMEAMREPTEAMRVALNVHAAERDHPWWWEHSVLSDPTFLSHPSPDAWTTLIDAALQ